ncbi:hypothetical protein SALB1_0537 [Salinisphaera sp. LB1]|nr:hypothetical protein SALB1_0537 [Salinisphaera sp. LB1]
MANPSTAFEARAMRQRQDTSTERGGSSAWFSRHRGGRKQPADAELRQSQAGRRAPCGHVKRL